MPKMRSKEAAMLSRVIGPEHGNWPRQAAETILRFAFPARDVKRMNVLAAKARDGDLTSDEQSELESYMRVGRFLELIKAKARLSLQHQKSAA